VSSHAKTCHFQQSGYKHVRHDFKKGHKRFRVVKLCFNSLIDQISASTLLANHLGFSKLSFKVKVAPPPLCVKQGGPKSSTAQREE